MAQNQDHLYVKVLRSKYKVKHNLFNETYDKENTKEIIKIK